MISLASRVLLLTIMLCAVGELRAQAPVDYARDIKPVFKSRCYACHGALKQESGLRLDTGRATRQGGDSGASVVAGQAEKSLLIEKVSAKDPAKRMPPEGEPLTASQIENLKAWIAQGATSPENESPEADPRLHWAFQVPRRPAVPVVAESDQVRNPIDAFVATSLASNGLTARPAATKPVLLRRVYLDLIGLPPTRDELQDFLADDSPSAYEAVVDRLLRDPRHGERWARHWMDIWRYSDWYGRRHVPDVWNSAPQIWRWRDWIVRSLNTDHGYDRMIREMLAADEFSPDDDEATVATGYLIRNWYALNPNDWMRSTVEHTGKAFLGLTFNCAHCHDHKYDPITQHDYFRLRAFFEPISIRQDRVPGEADPGPFQEYNYSSLRKIQRLGAVRIYDKSPEAPTWFYTGGDERNRVTERGSIAPGLPAFLTSSAPTIAPIELPLRAWNPGLRPAIHETLLAEARAALVTHQAAIAALDPAVADDALAKGKLLAACAELSSVEARIAAARAKYGETPGAEVAALARAASRLERDAVVFKAEADVLTHERAVATATAKPMTDATRQKELDAANKLLAVARPALDKARAAAADMSSEVYSPLGPAYPKTSTGRRTAVAAWIAGRDNPLTARVAINHLWARHFHAPLVATVTDFGRSGARPSHPELLDWLSVELMENQWSMKHVHRLIVTSAAYRRSSSAASPEGEKDAENKLLWRMNAGRMESEVVRDSLLYVAGKLDPKMGGQELENTETLTTFRRSLYYSVYPEQGGKSPLGELFDAPDALDCYRRTRSIVPQQSLALTNSDLAHQVSAITAAALSSDLGTAADMNSKDFVSAAFQRLLSRFPTDSELQLCGDAINRHRELLAKSNASDPSAKARESLVRVLLNHNDFVTIR